MHHLIVIHMHHCPGGMFESVPECYQVNDAGKITTFTFEKWKQRILSEIDKNCINKLSSQSPAVSLLTPTNTHHHTTAMSCVTLPSLVTVPSPVVALSSHPMTPPSPTVTLPLPSVSHPAPNASLPPPAVALSSPAVALPPPAVALPPPAVALPPPAVALPPPAVALPPPAVALPPPAVALPPPAVALPPPAVALPPPAVALPPPAVALPPPAVALPPPAVALPPPAVALPPPAVALPPPAVALPPPAVALSSPAVALPPDVAFPPPAVALSSPAVALQTDAVTFPSPAGNLPSSDLSQEPAKEPPKALDNNSQRYHSASWTKCSNWNAYLTEAVTGKHVLRGSQISEFQLLSPLTLVPSKKQLTLAYQPDQVKAIVDALNTQYPDVPGVALIFPCWAEMFNHDLSIIPPIGHVLDTIILCNDLSLEMWSCFSNTLSRSNLNQMKAYVFELCRLMKRYILTTSPSLYHAQHTAINLTIKPYIFETATQTLKSFSNYGNSSHEHYESYLGNVEGTLLDMVLTQLVNSTVSKVVWLRNRINKNITYYLTQQQCETFLQFCNDWILMVEAAPGCGKSVMAAYICQRFGGPEKPGNVLYVSPRKAFAAIVKYQRNADTYVARDENTLRKATSAIQQGKYKVIVVDDIQAMMCTQTIWDMLLDTVHSKKARLLLLMDSEYQNFHNNGSCEALRASIDEFCMKRHIPRKSSITLTTNLRNSQKVFSFLVAQIESHEDASSKGEFTCGHDIEGDDVHIRVIYNPWEDSADNDIIQLVTKLITQQGQHRYEVTDIVLLIDETEPQTATKLRNIFSTHSDISTCQASDIPHQSLVIDLANEFVGMEAPVCLVIFPSNHRLQSMKYRVFTASRGIMRTELVFMDDISADLVKTMALSNLAEAEIRTPVQ